MKLISDLHFHSKYSRAVSPQMILPEIAKWARIKGIDLVTTADFTHPLWFREIKANLEETSEGIYKLKIKNENLKIKGEPRFILTTEISCIYSQDGKGRRIHLVVMAPSISEVEKINTELAKRGNIMSDGRPILGMSARDLTVLVLSTSPEALIIPAHAYTPWFSLYGSESGFDSIDECFGDMAKYIYAVETGLSSDPVMNWRIGELDNRSIISNSDAHSGAKLGREATVFEIPETKRLGYKEIREAIMNKKREVRNGKWDNEAGNEISEDQKNQNISLQNPTSHIAPHISHTIEFYPEEGKYHYTGHRNCQVKQSPEETKRLGTTCPICGKGLTVGVMHRVEQLAKRVISNKELVISNDEYGTKWIGYEGRPSYAMLVPLLEILAESLNCAVNSQKSINEYKKLVGEFGGIGEFGILLESNISEIAKISGARVAEGIKKVRSGDINVDPGYDGVLARLKSGPSLTLRVNPLNPTREKNR